MMTQFFILDNGPDAGWRDVFKAHFDKIQKFLFVETISLMIQNSGMCLGFLSPKRYDCKNNPFDTG